MKKLLWVVSLTLIFIIANADVYTWKDSQGSVHYSDRPHEGATKIKLPSFESFTPPDSSQKIEDSDKEPASRDEEEETTSEFEYKSVAITQPDHESTIRNNQGFLLVSVELEPALRKGDKVQLIYDGAVLGDPQTSLIFQLNNIYRGSHTIYIEVLNPQGKILIKSQPITIYMHRPRIGGG